MHINQGAGPLDLDIWFFVLLAGAHLHCKLLSN